MLCFPDLLSAADQLLPSLSALRVPDGPLASHQSAPHCFPGGPISLTCITDSYLIFATPESLCKQGPVGVAGRTKQA